MEQRPTIMEFGQLRTNKLETIQKCQKWGLFPHEGTYMCPKCANPLILRQISRKIDGYEWICRFMEPKKRKRCNTTVSIRTNTFFEKSRLTIVQILAFVSMWMYSHKIKIISFELGMSPRTAVDWASFCKEVAYKSIVDNAELLGGDGKIVEIEESKFTKRKFNVGRTVRDNWVFGGYERGSGKVFMEVVEDRTRETLLRIIKKWIRPGTTIISDCWRAYDSLPREGYQHQNVNHTLNFVDPQTGAHTNSIESAWNAAKISIAPHNRKAFSMPGNLARYMLIKKAKDLGIDPVLYFYELAGKMYNPTRERDVETSSSEEEVEDVENTGEDDVIDSDTTI